MRKTLDRIYHNKYNASNESKIHIWFDIYKMSMGTTKM